MDTQPEKIIIMPESGTGSSCGPGIHDLAELSDSLISDIILWGLDVSRSEPTRSQSLIYAVPPQWEIHSRDSLFNIVRYGSGIAGIQEQLGSDHNNRWIILSDGRYVTRYDEGWLYSILDDLDADVVCVQVSPKMNPYVEKLRISTSGEVVGMRRIYHEALREIPLPVEMPHHLFIKAGILKSTFDSNNFSPDYALIRNKCEEKSLKIRSIQIGGAVLNLSRESDLLCFVGHMLDRYTEIMPEKLAKRCKINGTNKTNESVSPGPKSYGVVIQGDDVKLDESSIIVGPAILGNHVVVGANAVIRNSIIGPGCIISPGQCIENRIVLKTSNEKISAGISTSQRHTIQKIWSDRMHVEETRYRVWPVVSYMRFGKRIADIIFAAIVLLFFMPAFPIIALIIKLNSPGPILFGDKRQGFHGREFRCLKFRSMRIDAAENQNKLRIINQVDGPQFKLAYDPRITSVGRFLRDTCIDEIPQFINVLRGEMSVVGPRPSPEKENSLCAYWRDARLSVKPGITGLWQVRRTRTEGQDFQEWIYYDTQYVKNASLLLDLTICYQTAIKILKDFIKQF